MTVTTEAKSQRAAGVPLLQADNVTMRFGGLTAVNKVSMTVNEGEILGLIGPNGAGKTTFFNCLTGLYKPTEGQVRLSGVELAPKPRAVVKAGMARTFQNIRLFANMTALENVMVGSHLDPARTQVQAGRGGDPCTGPGAAGLRRPRGLHRAFGTQHALRKPTSAGDRPGPGHRPQARPAG
jgi:ABC-type Fe3+/spermidine/putrescine transport system ATPase subunit